MEIRIVCPERRGVTRTNAVESRIVRGAWYAECKNCYRWFNVDFQDNHTITKRADIPAPTPSRLYYEKVWP